MPFPMGHYIENIGTATLRFLEILRSAFAVGVYLSARIVKPSGGSGIRLRSPACSWAPGRSRWECRAPRFERGRGDRPRLSPVYPSSNGRAAGLEKGQKFLRIFG